MYCCRACSCAADRCNCNCIWSIERPSGTAPKSFCATASGRVLPDSVCRRVLLTGSAISGRLAVWDSSANGSVRRQTTTAEEGRKREDISTPGLIVTSSHDYRDAVRTSGFRNSCDFKVLSRTFHGSCSVDLATDHRITENRIKLGRWDRLKR